MPPCSMPLLLSPSPCSLLSSYKERLSTRAMIGIVLSMIGVGFIVTRGSWEVVTHSQYNHGDLMLLGTQLSWGVYTIYGRQLMRRISPWQPRLMPTWRERSGLCSPADSPNGAGGHWQKRP